MAVLLFQENNGCNGGLMDIAFEYVRNNKGIDTEECYPYTAKASATVGPLAVTVMATPNMQHYKEGIFTDTTCNTGTFNHGVLVVGYKPGYWIVKNSWGPAWGMAGYIHMARNRGNMCGIASHASFPTL